MTTTIIILIAIYLTGLFAGAVWLLTRYERRIDPRDGLSKRRWFHRGSDWPAFALPTESTLIIFWPQVLYGYLCAMGVIGVGYAVYYTVTAPYKAAKALADYIVSKKKGTAKAP